MESEEEIQEQVVLDEACIFIKYEAADKIYLLRELARTMNQKGYVKDTYCNAVIERERSYPTGLQTRVMGVAIPHADACHVNTPAISVAALANPIVFQSMADPDKGIPVELVLMLAIREADTQIAILQRIMSILQNDALLKRLKDCKDPREVKTLMNGQVKL